jgi:hypothetical protein
MGFTLERNFPGFGRVLPWSVTMTFAQMRQQIQLLFFRNRRVRPSDRNACLGKLLQQTIGGYAHHCGKLLDRYVRHRLFQSLLSWRSR